MLVPPNNFVLAEIVLHYIYLVINADEFTLNLVALTYFKVSNNFMEAPRNVCKQKVYLLHM